MKPWLVVGGKSSGGLLVRESQDLKSPSCAQRLAHSAVLQPLQLAEGRLRYRLLAGDGPQEGWVSLRWKGQELVSEIDEGQEYQVELLEVVKKVAQSLQRGPRFCASGRLHGNLIEVVPTVESTSLEDFWPSNCSLSQQEKKEVYGRITCSHSCDSCTLALALTLKELADCVSLSHRSFPVVNLLVLSTLLDISDLRASELFLLEPSGSTFPTFQTLDFSLDGQRLGLSNPKLSPETQAGLLDELGEAASNAVPHWWLAAVLRDGSNSFMLHMDLCNFAYDPSSWKQGLSAEDVLAFESPDFQLLPSSLAHRFRLDVRGKTVQALFGPQSPRQLSRHFGPVLATPVFTYIENKLGGHFGERTATDEEAEKSLGSLHGEYCKAASSIRQEVFQELPPGVVVELTDVPEREDLDQHLAVLLDSEGGSVPRRVRLLLVDEVLQVPVCSMKMFLRRSQYVSLAEMYDEYQQRLRNWAEALSPRRLVNRVSRCVENR
ncbi:unnamed protein product [Effrenium voratum]|nr:unnamed protein product [Effrenium voratum]